MALYQDWVDLYENQTEESFRKFWEDYSSAETKIYQAILSDPSVKMSGTIAEQAEKLGVDKALFMGFLDGINDSLVTPNEALEEMAEDTPFELDIDFEKLYYNMLDAKADYLYTLPEWDSILTDEKRENHESLPPFQDSRKRTENWQKRSMSVRQRQKIQEVLRQKSVAKKDI